MTSGFIRTGSSRTRCACVTLTLNYSSDLSSDRVLSVCQLSRATSLQVMGNVESGAKVVLWTETRVPVQTWSAQVRGRISSNIFPGMVMDIKGERKKLSVVKYDFINVVINK